MKSIISQQKIKNMVNAVDITAMICVFLAASLMSRGVYSTLHGKRPYNIAHRGSSGSLPENTVMAHQMAVQQGADMLECDIGLTKDLRLILLHESWLGEITDAKNKLDPTKKKTRYILDTDETITDFFSVDFTWNELRQLRVNQRFESRDQSYNGQLPIATLEEYIEVAQIMGKQTQLLIELRHPEFVNSLEIVQRASTRFEDLVLEVLQRYGYSDHTAPVLIQSFSDTSLKYLKDVTTIPLYKLLHKGDNVDDSTLTEYSSYLKGIAVNKELIYPTLYNKILQTTDLVARGHAQGLEVHVWTFRNEYQYLASEFNQDPYQELEKFDNLGIDGFITDFPATTSRFVRWRYNNECTCTQSKQTSRTTSHHFSPWLLLTCFLFL